MKKFEYKTLQFLANGTWVKAVNIEIPEIENTLNELGKEGWELVNTADYSLGGYTQKVILFLKREII